MPGNPGRTADGRYNIGEWQEFMSKVPAPGRQGGSGRPSTHSPADNLGSGDTKRDLEIEKLRLSNQKLQFDLEVRNKTYTSNERVERWVSDVVMNARRTLLSLPAKLAPTLTGRTEVEIERILKDAIHEGLTQLSEGSWTETPEPTTDPSENDPTGSEEP
jgi:hypothetical protein